MKNDTPLPQTQFERDYAATAQRAQAHDPHAQRGAQLHSVERVLTGRMPVVDRVWAELEAEIVVRRDNSKAH